MNKNSYLINKLNKGFLKMNFETINQSEKETLLNINKTNEFLDDKNSNINLTNRTQYKNDSLLLSSMIRSSTLKNIQLKKNISNKETVSLFNKYHKNVKVKRKDTDEPSDRQDDQSSAFNGSNLTNNFLNNNKKLKPFNIKNYYKSKTSKFVNQENKFALHKKPKANSLVKELENNKNNKLFPTEINDDTASNLKTNTNTNINTNINLNTFNNINSNRNSNSNYSPYNLSYQYKYSNKNSSREKKNKYSSYDKYPKNEDPLTIPKEDLVFEEIKKYKCFKHFTKEALKKTGIPLIYIDMNMDTKRNNTVDENKSKNDADNVLSPEEIKKIIDTGNDKIIFDKSHRKEMSEERKKEILDEVYRIKTVPDFYKKIENLKQKKFKKKLKGYQNNFLKLVKYNITDKNFDTLKDNFNDIRELAGGKYDNNYRFLKEIEKNEESVIKNINGLYNYYMKYFEKKNLKKIFIKPIGPKIKLPYLKFMKIFQKNEDKKIKDNSDPKHINLKKYKGKSHNKIHRNTIRNEFNEEKNIFYSTNYNKFKRNLAKKK